MTAHIKTIKNDVRRRTSSDLVWLPVFENNEIYLGDNIFSAESSSSVIDFTNGNELKLGAGTLITIEQEAGEDSVSLEHGAISGSISAKKSLFVHVGHQKREISGDGAKIQIIKDESGATHINVQEGQLKIKDGNQEKYLGKSQSISISENGTESLKSSEIELLSPQSEKNFWISERAPQILFQWKPVKDIQSYILKISRNFEFSQLTYSHRISTTSSDIASLSVQNLPIETLLYWKVEASDTKHQAASFVQTLYVKGDIAPTLKTPNNDEKIFYTESQDAIKSNKSTSVELTWVTNSKQQEFTLQLSKDATFSKTIMSQEVKGFALNSPQLNMGNYFWRVRLLDPERPDAVWSNPRHFTIFDKPMVLLPPPIISNPKFEYYKTSFSNP